MDHRARARVRHVTFICFRHGGTHLVKPLVKRILELPSIDVVKLGWLDHQPKGPVVLFWRDPRNIIVAAHRWRLRRKGQGTSSHDAEIARLIAPADGRRSPISAMIEIVRMWGKRPGAITCNFETLTGASRLDEAERIASELGAVPGTGAGALSQVIGTGPTFTGRHSDHREWFGPQACKAWDAAGGARLLDLMDYEA